MCLLVYKHPSVTFPTQHALEAAYSNRNGFGIAYHDGTRWQLHKTMELTTHVEALEAATPYPALIHYRLATHGVEDTSNVHPFLVGDPEDADAFVVAHNGIIDITAESPDDPRSDTRLFVEHVFAHLQPGWRDDSILLGQIERMLGHNKVAVLFSDGIRVLFGESKGHWSDDKQIWYSNHSYRRYLPAPSSYTGTGGKPTGATAGGGAGAEGTSGAASGTSAGTKTPVVGWTYVRDERRVEGTVPYIYTLTETTCDQCMDHHAAQRKGVRSMRPILAKDVRPGSYLGGLQCTECGSTLSDFYMTDEQLLLTAGDPWD